MCGIAGWYAWGKARPNADIVRGLLLAQQTRGMDAAGFAYFEPDTNKVIVRKQQGPAAKLIDDVPVEIWRRVASSPIGLLHARASTKGSEKNNENNHPVTGGGWTVVHNGHVRNDDELWDHYMREDKSLKRWAEVDTSAIPLVLSRGSTYIDSLERLAILGGSVTTAALSLAQPTHLALARLGSNDLYLVADTENSILYYTSAAVGIRVLPSLSVHTLRFSNLTKMPDDRLMVLEPGAPFTAKLYKVERHPFFEPRAHKHHTAHTTPNTQSANTATKPPAAAPSSRARDTRLEITSLKWERHDPAEDIHKPPPLPFSPKTFNLRAHEPAGMVSEAAKLSDYATKVFPTAYGRWMVIKQKKGLGWKFKPIKSVKKWMKKYYGDYSFPLALKDGSTALDDRLTLEILLVRTNLATGGVLEKQARLCPWCGIHLALAEWVALGYRCPHCNIRANRV